MQERITLLLKKGKEGDNNAQYSLGYCYYHGLFIKQNYIQAIRWFSIATNHMNASAMNGLGVMYFRGQGVIRDLKKAFILIERAAKEGNPAAIMNLAHFYRYGIVVRKNNVIAGGLYKLASNNDGCKEKANLCLNELKINIGDKELSKVNDYLCDLKSALGNNNTVYRLCEIS